MPGCNELFAWEKRFETLDPEERYIQRLEREKPVLDALSSWADSISGSVAPKSALGKALYYLREQWPYLIRYLEDGRLELSNNRAEHQALRYRTEELPLRQFPPGRPEQRRHLQPYRNSKGKRPGHLRLSGVGAGAGAETVLKRL